MRVCRLRTCTSLEMQRLALALLSVALQLKCNHHQYSLRLGEWQRGKQYHCILRPAKWRRDQHCCTTPASVGGGGDRTTFTTKSASACGPGGKQYRYNLRVGKWPWESDNNITKTCALAAGGGDRTNNYRTGASAGPEGTSLLIVHRGLLRLGARKSLILIQRAI